MGDRWRDLTTEFLNKGYGKKGGFFRQPRV